MSVPPDDIEAIKQRKLSEMRRRVAEEEQVERAQQEAEAQKEAILRAILSNEARSRLHNLRIVRPEFAAQLEIQLIQLAQEKRLPIPLTDDQLKRILLQLQDRKRDIRITRI
uniref:DNA-binding protein ENS19_01610 n=1 Tax=Candidatus Methanomethylicus mesodigestus TaxID=1867258 RepID=A0A7C3J1W1_9CREN